MFRERYTVEQRLEIEKVRVIFYYYIASSPYFDVVWNDKLRCYIWMEIDVLEEKEDILIEGLIFRNIDNCTVIENGRELCKKLLRYVCYDILASTGKNHDLYEVDEDELIEIKDYTENYMEKLPEYNDLLDEILKQEE